MQLHIRNALAVLAATIAAIAPATPALAAPQPTDAAALREALTRTLPRPRLPPRARPPQPHPVRPALRHAGPPVPERALLPGIGVTVVVTSRTSSAPAAIAFLLGYLAAFVPIVRYAPRATSPA